MASPLPISRDSNDCYCAPNNLPSTPPSSIASSPIMADPCGRPHHSVMVYVTERLKNHHPTPRFSYENPAMWPYEEDYLLHTPLSQASISDEDSTIISNSSRPWSRCSESTLLEDMPTLSHYHKNGLSLPSALPDCANARGWPDQHHTRSRKCSIATKSSAPSPKCMRQISSPIDDGLDFGPFAYPNNGPRPWPTFTAQREAPKPPITEKSAWEDSDDEEEPDNNQLSRFRRRLSSPFRAFWCKGKEVRRKSA